DYRAPTRLLHNRFGQPRRRVFLHPFLFAQLRRHLDDVALRLLSLDFGGGFSVDSVCHLRDGPGLAIQLVSRRGLLRRANIERWVGSRRTRVDGCDWPRLDVDRCHRMGPNVAGARLEVGAGRRTDLHRLRLNVGRMWGHFYAASAGRSGHWLRRPDIGLARRHVGRTGLDIGRRRGAAFSFAVWGGRLDLAISVANETTLEIDLINHEC